MGDKKYERGFRCGAEWHLHHSGLALAMYTKLCSVTWDKEMQQPGVYYSSVQALADYFGILRQSASRVVNDELIDPGWVEIVERRDPNKSGHTLKVEVLRSKDLHPITHDEWVERHGDKTCRKRLAVPWDNETKDTLAIALHRESKGQVKWYAGMVKGLRNIGALDDEILRAYRHHVSTLEKEPRTARGWQADAFKWLAEFRRVRSAA